MSTFVSIFVQDISGRTQLPATVQQQPQNSVDSERKRKLQDALFELDRSATEQSILAALVLLRDTVVPSEDPEEEHLKQVLLGRVVLGVYAEALHTYLDQTTEAEREAEWWDNIERSHYELAWYLLQSKVSRYSSINVTEAFAALPARFLNLFRTVASALQAHNIPMTLSSLKPAYIRQVLPTSVNSLHYNALTKAMFPHLHRYPSTSFSLAPARRAQAQSRPRQALTRPWGELLRWNRVILSTIILPIELARQECRLKRQELETIRDERAEVLGSLSEMRLSLWDSFDVDGKRSLDTTDLCIERYSPLIDTLQRKLDGRPSQLGIRPGSVERLLDLSTKVLPGHRNKNLTTFVEHGLKRPSNLVLVWPKLVLGPPLFLYGIKLLYASRTSLQEVAKDTWETFLGLSQGWLIDPLKDVLKTVRAGGEGGIIVQKEAVASDLAVSELSLFVT